MQCGRVFRVREWTRQREVLRGFDWTSRSSIRLGMAWGWRYMKIQGLAEEKTKLAAGMAITIEPGVYIEGLGGIRIEDTVVVTANGCQVLTPTGKNLVAL